MNGKQRFRPVPGREVRVAISGRSGCGNTTVSRLLAETLGVKAMVTSLNYLNQIPLALLRRRFDLVDNHVYFDHPGFPEKPWSHPFSYRQYSAIRQMAVVPRNLMATRLPGKPFIVTEFNYCNPNIFRAEGGPLIGGYAALQNWDALYRFAWSHSASGIYKVGSAYGFDAVNDPMAQLSDRIAIAMFRRGDVAPAKVTYAYTVSPECFERNEFDAFPAVFQNLGLVTGIGSIPEGDRSVPKGTVELTSAQAKNPASLKDARIAKLWREANDKRLAVSATGQLRLDGNAGSFTVTTPRTESITLPAGSLAAGTLRVRDASCFQTVAAISLDDKPLAESSSVLVIQVVFNMIGEGRSFADVCGFLLLMSMILLPVLGVIYYCEKRLWPVLKLKLGKTLHTELFQKARKMDLRCYDDAGFYTDFIWTVQEAEDHVYAAVRNMGSVLLHVCTRKGYGNSFCENAPVETHGVGRVCMQEYSAALGEELVALAEKSFRASLQVCVNDIF